MSRIFLLVLHLFLLLPAAPGMVFAAVEVGRAGAPPKILEDVYLREGTAFVAIDDVLVALELKGEWDSVAHVYTILTPHGRAVISPGSQFLRVGDNLIPIAHRPRFIDGKLRISEVFLQRQLAPLLAESLHYRNYSPPSPVEAEDPLDRLFSFLLRKKEPMADGSKWIIAIDPGHGGEDAGALGLSGSKEKAVTLALAQQLEKLLKRHQDVPVFLTRDGDYTLDLERRLAIVAEGGADVLVSLHAQAFPTAEPSGIMLYVQPQTELDATGGLVTDNESARLAKLLQRELTTAGFVVRGVQEIPVLPLGRGDLPRVLVEMGSLSNAADLAMLQDQTRQQDFSRALFAGLNAFFNSYTAGVAQP